MPSNMITKSTLAVAIKELIENQPLSKISVKDITDYCNISRGAFYYHFKDKYDLITWIFSSEMIKNVNTFSDPSKLTESFVSTCNCIYEKKKFYFACFQYVGQNSLYEYLQHFYYEMWKINIDMGYQECGFKLSENELDMMARMKAHALVGIIGDWVNDGMRDNYMSYFESMRSILDSEAVGYSFLSNQKMMENRTEKYNEDFERKNEIEVC